MTEVESATLVLVASLDAIAGCSNHGCPFATPFGMRTNGPCRCAEDRSKRLRMVQAIHEFRKKAEPGLIKRANTHKREQEPDQTP